MNFTRLAQSLSCPEGQHIPWFQNPRCVNDFSVARLLNLLFSRFLYPLLIIVILAAIVLVIVYLVYEADLAERVRRTIAASLPFIALVFSQVSVDPVVFPEVNASLAWLLSLLGMSLGVITVEWTKLVLGPQGAKGVAALYILLVASIGASIIYLIMESQLEQFRFLLIGFVMAAGLDVVFRGLGEHSALEPNTDTNSEPN
jgi:hypothetical protein